MIRLWNPDDGQLVRELKGHDSLVTGAEFLNHGREIISAALDGTVRIWATDSGRLLHQRDENDAGLWSVSVSPNLDRAADAGRDRLIRLFKLPSLP